MTTKIPDLLPANPAGWSKRMHMHLNPGAILEFVRAIEAAHGIPQPAQEKDRG